ncbi:MAG TPA: hypothetical protein VEQ58_15260, partial [Polyangiaceae bacterium]|nr:hypothetical protein [Polyangiaceae bacterium]
MTQACGSSGDSDGTAGKSGVAGAQASTAGSGGAPVGQAGSTTGTAGTSGSGSGTTAGTGNGGSGSGGTPGTAGTGTTAGTGGTGNPPTGGTGAGGSPPVNQTDSVLQRNNNASRDGLFVQPKLTKAAIATMAPVAAFNTGAKFTGNMWASPLYLAPAAASGKGLFFAVTTGNDVIAIDETSGMTVWTKSIGTPATANGVNCGNIHPLAIL